MVAPYRRTGSTNDAPADFALDLEKNPLLRGVLLEDLELDGSAAAQYFHHGLERAYRQALKLTQSSSGGLIETMDPRTVEANGQDPAKVVGVHVLIANAMTFSLWVF